MMPDDCVTCSLSTSRSDFIRGVSASIAAALASVGVSSDVLAAVPVSAVARIGGTGATHTYPVPAEDGVQIDKTAEIIVVRWHGAVYAFNLSCPHQYTALRWNADQHRFKCPKHNSRYEPDGTFVDGRATRGMDRFAITHDNNTIVVDVDKMFKQDEAPTNWANAVVHLP